MKNYLSFENEIKNLENELDKLKDPYSSEDGISEVDTNQINKTQNELSIKLKELYSNLDCCMRRISAQIHCLPQLSRFRRQLYLLFRIQGLFCCDRSFWQPIHFH